MRYDRGYGRDYGGRQGMRGYDQGLRGMRPGPGPVPRGWSGERYDAQYGRGVNEADRGAYGWHHGHGEVETQLPAPGETDFLGRPYTPAQLDTRPRGLIDQTRAQERMEYDRGYRGAMHYDAGYRSRDRRRPPGPGREDLDTARHYDMAYRRPGTAVGYGPYSEMRRGPAGSGGPEGFGARRRYGQDYGSPYDYHPRFMPDSDISMGLRADNRRHSHDDLRWTSNWTRWF